MDPIKYIFEKFVLNERLSRWTLMLSKYDLKFIPLKVIKGRAVADFLIENPVNEDPMTDSWLRPDEGILCTNTEAWDIYFDGASNLRCFGVGILLISPNGGHIPISVKLDFNVTNVAEYEACLIGLQAAMVLGIKRLRVHDDSSIMIHQVSGSWKIRSDNLAPQTNINEEAEFFNQVDYYHLPREDNKFADAPAKLSSLIKIPDDMTYMPLRIERRSKPAYIYFINNKEETHNEPCYQAILNHKKKNILPIMTKKTKNNLITLLVIRYKPRSALKENTSSLPSPVH
ncbi:uncharacterized protein LOC141632876 [Silene latifolia]|uniref:uncharacterized protein LOC141632876 n=1 Tax=Silene latifolia TaxID=37657 RepID=UPI003D7782E1